MREDILIEKGYDFTGFYSRDKDLAKIEAKKYRDTGYLATVVLISGSKYSRGGSMNGYSVYAKKVK